MLTNSETVSKKQFSDFSLNEPILRAVKETGYTHPTPIQTAAIPALLKGRDLLGCAQTGTGKTAAFALPILNNLVQNARKPQPKQPRALILTPTRELAVQIHDSFKVYGKHLRLRYSVIFGGVGQGPQVDSVRHGVDVLVATPGRLMDLINQRHLSLSQLEVFVLDEADRMLDMGFIHAIRKIIALLPPKRHNLFFSATMPPEIARLADTLLSEPVKVEVAPVSSTAERIQQSVMFVEKGDKKSLLRHVLKDASLHRVIVFTRTKHGANKVAEVLKKNQISSAAIHGNKSQSARQHALEDFRKGKVRVLVATDIAARGIDIDDISHVINFEIPNISESYVHRIGRTARAGADGKAISFCDAEEKAYLKDIEKLIGQSVPVDTEHPYHAQHIANSRPLSKGKAKAKIEAEEERERQGFFGRRRHHPHAPVPKQKNASSEGRSQGRSHGHAHGQSNGLSQPGQPRREAAHGDDNRPQKKRRNRRRNYGRQQGYPSSHHKHS